MISTEAFDGIFDKSGIPFVLHQVRVALKGKTDDERIVGMLHDLVEDVDGWTFERLLQEGFAPHIVQAIDNLTRRQGETYQEFIERCCSSLLSINVKLYDLEDNMDINRLILITRI
jgi:(p)ppGpp synthase/HD superfamily hydrolase